MPQDEKLKILEMVNQGKIGAEEGAKLLAAVEQDESQPRPAGKRAEWLRVRVNDPRGKAKVNVNLPLALLDVALKFVPEDALQTGKEKIDLQEITEAIRQGSRGKIVEVEGENGEQVEIFVE